LAISTARRSAARAKQSNRYWPDRHWSFISIPQFPYQEGSNLNAGNIKYVTLKAAAVLRKLQDLEAKGFPSN